VVYLPLILSYMSNKDLTEENLQERLYLLQNEANLQNISFYVILEGWAQTGKGQILKSITYRMDPKRYKVYSPIDTDYFDTHYPFLYKYWQHFPAKGHALFLLKSYYHRITKGYSDKKFDKKELLQAQTSILNLEKTLSDDGVVFIKFFLDLNKKELEKRLKLASKLGKTWEVTKEDKDQVKHYKKYESIFKSYRELTDQPYAPWTSISADESSSAKIKVMLILIRELERVLKVNSEDLLEKLLQTESTE
jgi:AMP-polyphosphate phosphotransferase